MRLGSVVGAVKAGVLSLASSVHGVVVVVPVGADDEVGRIAALGVVAGVSHQKSILNRSMGDQIGNTACRLAAALVMDHAISLRVPALLLPRPAFTRTASRHSFPESGFLDGVEVEARYVWLLRHGTAVPVQKRDDMPGAWRSQAPSALSSSAWA